MNAALPKAQQMFNPKRRHKYNAVRVEIDGKKFASKKEGRVYSELTLRQQAGEIRDLECQVKIPLLAWSGEVGQSTYERIGHYICDFKFFDMKRACVRYLDAKGVKTALFVLKSKIVKSNYGIEIETV